MRRVPAICGAWQSPLSPRSRRSSCSPVSSRGVVGLGLPTVAMGLLAVVMTPAQAAALLVVPSFLTNAWQAMGPELLPLTRRLWSMLLGICAGTWAGAGLITAADGAQASAALGAVLALYGVLGLTAVEFPVPGRFEPWLSPVIGVATGIVTAATGVYMIPSAPYLQAIGLEKDRLVHRAFVHGLDLGAGGRAGAGRRVRRPGRRRVTRRARAGARRHGARSVVARPGARTDLPHHFLCGLAAARRVSGSARAGLM